MKWEEEKDYGEVNEDAEGESGSGGGPRGRGVAGGRRRKR